MLAIAYNIILISEDKVQSIRELVTSEMSWFSDMLSYKVRILLNKIELWRKSITKQHDDVMLSYSSHHLQVVNTTGNVFTYM